MSDREESAMGDERLTETVARAIREAPIRATLGGNVIDPTAPLTDGELNRGRAALAAIRNAGFAIVATEGPEFEAASERAARAIFESRDDEVGWEAILSLAATGDPYMQGQVEFIRNEAQAGLRAALAPGDQG